MSMHTRMRTPSSSTIARLAVLAGALLATATLLRPTPLFADAADVRPIEPPARGDDRPDRGGEPQTAETKRPKPAPPKDIDHFLTGFPLRGAHINVECESCHARGVMQGTARLCSDCHRNAGPVRASAKPLDHVVTRAECDRCHTERSWLGARFVHSADTAARCFSCHNGRAAQGKSRDHIPAPDTCQDCHGTRTFSLF